MVNTIVPKDSNNIWFGILCVLGIMLVVVIINKHINTDKYNEGFSQESNYVVKTEKEVYDDFYVELYDRINIPEKHSRFIIERVITMTAPTKKSVFLDIGCGTGQLLNDLQTAGYDAYGIDYSESMVRHALKKYPDCSIKHADITVPLTYDRNTFSHLLCTGMTIYQIQDKRTFFRHCYFWLKPNGYLILHLVDKNRFDPIIEAGKPSFMPSPQQYADSRITDTVIDFLDFKYKASYQFTETDVVYFKETMTDTETNHVRQNELTLYMEDYNDILYQASRNGFIVHGQVNLAECIGDQYQYIFILERTL
jgi:ubiquinone/menaquinone biosynthesis C-methylase UbiE